MAINQLKVVISFLREVSDGNIPTARDYDIADEQYWDIIDAIQDAGLIKGAAVARGGYVLDSVKMTIKGMEYLNRNAQLAKAYEGLGNIQEWIQY